MERLESVVADDPPDFAFVPGDVNSTLAAALAAGRTAVVDARCDPNENCYPMVPAGAAAIDVREAPEQETLPA